jgi:regulator of sigma E protease
VTTILVFAVVISVLVMVHELGHHLMAKWFGVPVEVFSVGFGPRLIGFRYSGTEYRVSAIPFGGYVKMAGTSLSGRDATPNGFDSKAPWQRFVILLAGPVMNIGFAMVLATVALWLGIELPAYRSDAPIVSAVVDQSAAQRSGVKSGDRIIAVSGQEISSWAALDSHLAARASQSILLTLQRGDDAIDVRLPAYAEPQDALGIGVLPDAHPVVRSVEAGQSADRAGLRPGDVIVSIGGEPTNVLTDVAAVVASSPGGSLSLDILRAGQRRSMTLAEEGSHSFGAVALIPMAVFRPEPSDALFLGVRALAGSSVEILKTLGGLITGNISASHLIGPVGLAQIAGESSQLGWRALLAAIAFISLNLGLCNLLPIPILDGGHMLMLVVEGVIRRDVPFGLRKVLVGAGAVAMLLLLATTFYNDLSRLGWLSL